MSASSSAACGVIPSVMRLLHDALFSTWGTALCAYSCGVCMSSVTSCVGGGLFTCFTCLHVPYSTVTLITWGSRSRIMRSM
jgi:hypothetical protein